MFHFLQKWWVGGIACLAVFGLGESEAHACHESRVCVELGVSASDDYVGDFGNASHVRARGVRVRLVSPDEPVREAYLDNDGCLTFETRHVYGLKMVVYPESYVGVDRNVHIRAFESRQEALAAQVEDEEGTYDVDDLPEPWLIEFLEVPIGNLDDPVVGQIIPDDISRMLGWTLEAFHNVDAYAGILGEQELLLHTETDDPRAGFGAYALGDLMMLGPIARESKFIAAHELGHWYQSHWVDRLVDTRYSYGLLLPPQPAQGFDVYAKNPPCDFTFAPLFDDLINDAHGIRSAEWAAPAMGEGFGQFFASLAYNDPGEPDGNAEFRYYKEIDLTTHPDYQDLYDDDYIVELIGSAGALGGTNAWVPNMCPDDWDTPINGLAFNQGEDANTFDFVGHQVSSEIDWQRMFWGFIADPEPSLPSAGTAPNLRTILDLFTANNSLSGDDIYADFQSMMDDPGNLELYPHRTRFEAVAMKNGVQTND